MSQVMSSSVSRRPRRRDGQANPTYVRTYVRTIRTYVLCMILVHVHVQLACLLTIAGSHRFLPPGSGAGAAITIDRPVKHITTSKQYNSDSTMSVSANKRSAPGAGAAPSLGLEAIASMTLLALQFGMQPALTRQYTPPATCRSAVIIMQECVKFVIAIFMLSSSGQLKPSLEGWTVSSWLTIAFLPAALYVVQNLSALMAYQNLHPVTFNVLNQTKTVRPAIGRSFLPASFPSSSVLSTFISFFTGRFINPHHYISYPEKNCISHCPRIYSPFSALLSYRRHFFVGSSWDGSKAEHRYFHCFYFCFQHWSLKKL